ncbi:Transcriptional regulator, GntR family [Candidatus Syntrophocurvum alkaliphilum]|uniref:Transcriptional regulator, GntR family n=1 Tax=Candidatus Syntrophocurvum alkaliphilum TaxID=2293317 RepID=A0A6I6DBA5_9FIRM|nr:GntR family transcriptional regulator [Candidatus Syntrophocurvum alkaliphilum]QGT99945.1 Transcriptional regulator, GntR family [Candidatus Syntrophocurvum alkaliphilum]
MFELDLRSRLPIYEQLVEKIKDLIINNVLKPDEKLPTVRELASELTVNPNTVQKAYRELEHLGFIYSVPGKGNFVREVAPEHNTARLQALENELSRIINEMLYLGTSPEEIDAQINALLPKDKGGNSNDSSPEG